MAQRKRRRSTRRKRRQLIRVSPALRDIGVALVATGDGEPVELTDEQRKVLARATVPATLDAILAHVSILPHKDAVPRIAKAWSDELRAAFQSQSIVDKITEDDNLQSIRSVVLLDDRLSTEEQRMLLRALRDRYGSADSGSTSSQSPTRPRPRAYLASISVEGFRGIGPHADLLLEPQPGLTLVYGANGSGKSTFVEALDVLLTGNTARFAGRGHEWRSAWANAHSPDRGQIDAEFAVEDQGAQRDTLTRNWTADDLSAAAGEKDSLLWGPAKTIGGLAVAGAIDEFRPILGYGELGPLCDESGSFDDPDSGYVTPFAQHIRARASIRDGVTDALWKLIRHRDHRAALYTELSAWQSWIREVQEVRRAKVRKAKATETLAKAKATEANARLTKATEANARLAEVMAIAMVTEAEAWRVKAEKQKEKSLQLGAISAARQDTRRSPSDWSWKALMNAFNVFDENTKTDLLGVARVYLPRFPDELRESIAQSAAQEHFGKKQEFLAYTPRVGFYAEMLLDEIHSARLEQFSQRVSDFWQKIRRGSDVRFEALSLQQHRPIDEEGKPAPELRVSLGLTIDGDRAIERGALSQGELHSLALSVFLPALMMPGSPFGFAVIDDPVQVMDEHAVDGLAEVLRDAAEDLQLIVFTHDSRLLRALNVLNADYTRIDVTRSSGSVVECKTASDPVIDRIKKARTAADHVDDQWQRQGVALQCRLAIEAACLRVIRASLAGQRSAERVEDTIERATQGTTTTRDLMERAIFGGSRQAKRARDRGTYRNIWDDQVETTLDRINGLVHAVFEEEAREAYSGDLHALIDDVEYVISVIEADRG